MSNQFSVAIPGLADFGPKGSLIAGAGGSANDTLAVGTNNFVLTADSSQTLGLKWAASSSAAAPFWDLAEQGVILDGVTVQTTQLQTAIDAAPAGATIFFSGIAAIDAPIIAKTSCSYVGAGRSQAQTAGLKISPGSGANFVGLNNVTGMLIMPNWANNVNSADNPILVSNLSFDGSNEGTASSCTSVLFYNFWSVMDSCYVLDMGSGDGVSLTDTTDDGTISSNSESENRVTNNKITNCDGYGISTVSGNNNSNMDGYIQNNTIDGTGSGGIGLARGAGWTIDSNHFYGGILGDCISAPNSFATSITNNYIEDFGLGGSSSSFWSGISMTILDGRGCVVANNRVFSSEATTGAHYLFINLVANSGQTDASVVCNGNMIQGNGGPNGIGVVYDSKPAALLHFTDWDNPAFNINADRFYGTGTQTDPNPLPNLVVPGTTTLGSAQDPSAIALDLYGVATQSADYFRITDSTSTAKYKFQADGTLFVDQFVEAQTGMSAGGQQAVTDYPLGVYGSAGFTQDYTRWIDSSATVVARVENDGGFNSSGTGTFAGLFVLDGTNIAFDTTVGSQIGTNSNQKLAFYASTPIVQPSGNLLAAIDNLGLVSSPTIDASDVGTGAALLDGSNQPFTDDLTISSGGGSALYLTANAATNRVILAETSGSLRSAMFLANNDAESGANAGSNFALQMFDDTGSALGSALTFTRSTLAAQFGGDVTISKIGPVLTVAAASGSASLVAAASTGGNANLALNRPAGQKGYINALTSGQDRWYYYLANGDAESGANAGSNLQIDAFDDSQVFIGRFLTGTRADLSATFGGTLATADPGSGSGAWLLGTKVTAASVLDGANYLEVKVDGTVYKVCIAV